MRALTKKLWRDLRYLRGQAVAIALVIAAGVAIYVVMESTLVSLDLTQRTYYERYRFADVFAAAKRAPLSLASEIAAIPGVAQVEARVVSDVLLDVPGLVEPAVGRLVGIPAPRRPMVQRRRFWSAKACSSWAVWATKLSQFAGGLAIAVTSLRW